MITRRIFIVIGLFTLMSCNDTPEDKIISYAKEKYGNDFKEGIIDLSDVFNFRWDKMYVFSPLSYPEDISKAIGFEYDGEIVPDDNYLLLFIKDSSIVKQYPYYRIRIGFSDDNYTGVYVVEHNDAKYNVVFRGKDNYWLYKVE